MRSMESKSLSAIRPQKMSSRASDRSGNLAMSIQSVKSIRSYGGISNRSALGMKDFTSGREPVPRLGPFASSSHSVYRTGPRQAGQSQQQMSVSYSLSTRQQRQSVPYYAKPIRVQVKPPQQTPGLFESLKQGATHWFNRIIG